MDFELQWLRQKLQAQTIFVSTPANSVYLQNYLNTILFRTMSAVEPYKSEFSKPVIYSCSGCSDAGELADLVARRLSKQGVGEMSCLAGIGGRVKPLMLKAQKAERIIAVDGCPLNCARHTLEGAGFNQFQHVELHKLGHRKGNCPVTEERVAEATRAAAELICEEKPAVKDEP